MWPLLKVWKAAQNLVFSSVFNRFSQSGPKGLYNCSNHHQSTIKQTAPQTWNFLLVDFVFEAKFCTDWTNFFNSGSNGHIFFRLILEFISSYKYSRVQENSTDICLRPAFVNKIKIMKRLPITDAYHTAISIEWFDFRVKCLSD